MSSPNLCGPAGHEHASSCHTRCSHMPRQANAGALQPHTLAMRIHMDVKHTYPHIHNLPFLLLFNTAIHSLNPHRHNMYLPHIRNHNPPTARPRDLISPFLPFLLSSAHITIHDPVCLTLYYPSPPTPHPCLTSLPEFITTSLHSLPPSPPPPQPQKQSTHHATPCLEHTHVCEACTCTCMNGLQVSRHMRALLQGRYKNTASQPGVHQCGGATRST